MIETKLRLATARTLTRTIMFAATFVLALGLAQAQTPSTDRDNPTLLTSNFISNSGVDEKTEYFYSFAAGPGQVTLTLDVKAQKNTAVSSVDIEVFDAKAQSRLSTYANPDHGASKHAAKTLNLTSKQTLLLQVTVSPGVETYSITLDGPIDIPSASAASDSGNSSQSAAQPEASGDSSGQSSSGQSFDNQTINGLGVEEKTESLYAFSAGPGEITLKLNVKSQTAAAVSSVDLELLDDHSQRLASGFANPSLGASKQTILTAKLTRKQTVRLKITVSPGVQNYSLGVSGHINGMIRGSNDNAAED